MKIKIVKRAQEKKIPEKLSQSAENTFSDSGARRAIAKTIQSWIEDLREKREVERHHVRKLFGGEHCV